MKGTEQAAVITTQGQVAELKSQTAMAMAEQRKGQSEKLLKVLCRRWSH